MISLKTNKHTHKKAPTKTPSENPLTHVILGQLFKTQVLKEKDKSQTIKSKKHHAAGDCHIKIQKPKGTLTRIYK